MRAPSLLLGLPLIFLLGGCLGEFRVAQTPAPAPAFLPEVFFMGTTHGAGVLDVRGRPGRPFTVAGIGHAEGAGTFVLNQTITFADGKSQRRSFRMQRKGEHDYVGSLTGAASAVNARADGNSFHLSYHMSKPAVTMEQWIYLQPDGRTAFNRATVRVLGMPVAHLSETITRQ